MEIKWTRKLFGIYQARMILFLLNNKNEWKVDDTLYAEIRRQQNIILSITIKNFSTAICSNTLAYLKAKHISTE